MSKSFSCISLRVLKVDTINDPNVKMVSPRSWRRDWLQTLLSLAGLLSIEVERGRDMTLKTEGLRLWSCLGQFCCHCAWWRVFQHNSNYLIHGSSNAGKSFFMIYLSSRYRGLPGKGLTRSGWDSAAGVATSGIEESSSDKLSSFTSCCIRWNFNPVGFLCAPPQLMQYLFCLRPIVE